MPVVLINLGMQIANAAQLPAGMGAKYIEVLEPHEACLALIVF
jgi:hypothetical protein